MATDMMFEYIISNKQKDKYLPPSISYWTNNQLHKTDGPSVVNLRDGSEVWYYHGKIHRPNGPAVTYPDGSVEWWLHGVKLTEQEVMGKQEKKEVLDELDDLGQKFDADDNVKNTPNGGPSSYYDMPFQDWLTLNDQIEYLSQNKWGKYSVHLKDVFKGLGRWGDKKGTSPEYDTKKGIYYFCRVMKMMVGVEGLRDYLNELLDNPQFKRKD